MFNNLLRDNSYYNTMISFSKVVVCVIAFIAVASAVIPTEDGVLVLDDTNFEEASNTYDALLVDFYAPWCGHCKTLAPEWVKAAKALSDSPIKLAKVDATIAKKLAETNGIQGFPTIKYFKKGKASDYSGGRVDKEIIAWVNKKSGPAFHTLTTEEELSNLQGAHESIVVGVFTNLESEAAKSFMALATDSDDQIYAVASSAAVLGKLAVSEDTVVVLKNFDELRNDLSVSGGFIAEDVTTFISGSTVPLIQEFSQESSKKIFQSSIQKHCLLFVNKESSSYAPSVEALKKIAGSFKGKALFVTVPPSEDRVYEYFEITEDQLPTLIVADMGAENGMKKYLYKGAIEEGPMGTFMDDFFAGKIEAYLKSEKVEPEDMVGPVIVAKGESFNDIVINNTKDVFVEFYAPWCGHCKTLTPIWESLAEKVKGNDNVVIVKVDAVANEIDVPGVAIKGFPSIYWFKGDDKANPVKYENGRELTEFISYIKANSHNNHEEL